jgi:hypothetical protein
LPEGFEYLFKNANFVTTKRVSVEVIKRQRVGAVKYINILDLTCYFPEIAL